MGRFSIRLCAIAARLRLGIIAVTVAIMCPALYHQQEVFGQAAFAGDKGARPPGGLQSSSCTPPENAVVTHILTDQGTAKKLYASDCMALGFLVLKKMYKR